MFFGHTRGESADLPVCVPSEADGDPMLHQRTCHDLRVSC
jgi:hypothetical protein